jgi:hypothetical protein
MGIVKETRESTPYGCYATINHTENQVNKKIPKILTIIIMSLYNFSGFDNNSQM